MNNIGILTNIDANHGSCVFNEAIVDIIRDLEVGSPFLLDCMNAKFTAVETLRALKLNPQIPFYNLQRHITLHSYSARNLPIHRYPFAFNTSALADTINRKKYQSLIVGKVVWDISPDSPLVFPSIFWLPGIQAKTKIAYAASGHRTDLSLFRNLKGEVLKLLSSFDLISVRDEITELMMVEAGVDKVVPVSRVCDPAFLFKDHGLEIGDILRKYGIPDNRPIVGLQFYGRPELSKALVEYFHKEGALLLNISMYNPYADINIGHLVDPAEWVALIKHFSFCITDRFHTSVFCIRENVPFIALEPYSPKDDLNSKIISLLKDFSLYPTCYYAEGRPVQAIIEQCADVNAKWVKDIAPKLKLNVKAQINKQKEFIRSMKGYLSG
jgi:hypothetical protein